MGLATLKQTSLVLCDKIQSIKFSIKLRRVAAICRLVCSGLKRREMFSQNSAR